MPKEDKGKVKMTVIQFETESDNATLQENIRAITNTLARALAPQPRVIQAAPQLPNGNGDNGANGDAKSSEQPSLFDNNDDAIDGEVTPAPAAKAKAKSSSPRQLPTPQTLELDLKSGDVPLKEFLEQKKPSGNNKRYLVIAYWLKTYLGINAITMNETVKFFRTQNSLCSLFYFPTLSGFQTPTGFGNSNPNVI